MKTLILNGHFQQEKKNLSFLNPDEQKILPFLIEAVEKVDDVFKLQENNGYKGANFYPADASKEEIEEAALENPNILSPFTVVKRNQAGKLKVTQYHKEYVKFLLPISKLILKAEKICENKSFKNYLKKLSKALETGNYQQADIAWLRVKKSNIDLIIGPYERYLDKLFFAKRSYQGYLGIIDQELTKRAKSIRNILYMTIGQRPYRIVPPSIVDINILKYENFSGFLKKSYFTTQHLPSDSDTTARFGSRILGFASATDVKFEKLIYPIFCQIFEKKFKISYSKELLKNGNYYYILLSAIAQQLHRYQNSRTRLKELFPILDEANSIVSGITQAKHLVLKGVINQKELEAILIVQICWIFSEWVLMKQNNIREDYLKGDALTLNFLLGEEAVQEKDGVSWPNFAKIFFEMENLASIFTRLLAEGTYMEAQEFLSKYSHLDQFKRFENRLSKVKLFKIE